MSSLASEPELWRCLHSSASQPRPPTEGCQHKDHCRDDRDADYQLHLWWKSWWCSCGNSPVTTISTQRLQQGCVHIGKAHFFAGCIQYVVQNVMTTHEGDNVDPHSWECVRRPPWKGCECSVPLCTTSTNALRTKTDISSFPWHTLYVPHPHFCKK